MFENEYRFPIMGSTALKGKAPASWRPADWQRFHRSFALMNVTPREMAIHVWRGFSFTPVFTEARREEYYKWAYHIALDFDTGDETSSLPFLMEIPGTFGWMLLPPSVIPRRHRLRNTRAAGLCLSWTSPSYHPTYMGVNAKGAESIAPALKR